MTASGTHSNQPHEKYWTQKRLGDLCRTFGGGTPSRNQPSYWNGEIPWASVKDFTDDSIILSETKEHITKNGLESSPSTLVPAGTPVLCTRMAVGRCALTTRSIAINQDLKAFLLNDELVPKFFIRILRHHCRHLERFSIGSTVRGITTSDLLALPLEFPSKFEQTRIAAVLDTVDEVIAKTEAVIAKLRQIRAGLLHDLLTRGLDHNGQLRDPIAHPEQFQDSPLGRIPKEWEIRRLSSLCSHIGSGVTPRGGQDVYTTGGVMLIRSQNVVFEGLLLDDVAFISEVIHLGMLRSEVFAHDVLFNITGASIGRCCPMPQGLGTANVNQHVCALRVPQATASDAKYLASFLASPIGQHQMDSLLTVGNRQGLNYQQLGSFVIPWPKAEERELISGQLLTVESQISSGEKELAKLTLLKSGLMTDLLTGRVRVPEN